MDETRFATASLRDARVRRVLSAALEAVDPAQLVENWLMHNPLPEADRVFILAVGKAAEAMARSALTSLPRAVSALAITKHATPKARLATTEDLAPRLTLVEAGHPVPDERSLRAGKAVATLASKLDSRDLLLCLISGGGSALVASPKPGVSLRDLQQLTDALLASGATIQELNLVRRSLDTLKGGGLIGTTRARVLSLIISDVIGNSLQDIASGPTTVANPEPHGLAQEVLRTHGISATRAVIEALETPSPEVPNQSPRVENIVLADNSTAVEAAAARSALEGVNSAILNSCLQGEASVVGLGLAGSLREAAEKRPRPFCLIAGGETTVTLADHGTGGRNQELALAAVDPMHGLRRSFLISMATDGDDGPTDAAGAVVTGETRSRGLQLGLSAGTFLQAQDSYHYFQELGDLLQPGYTGTNVNDLILLVGL